MMGTEYRACWTNPGNPRTYTSEVMRDLDEAYEYRDSIRSHTTRIWIEAARWEVFDEGDENAQEQMTVDTDPAADDHRNLIGFLRDNATELGIIEERQGVHNAFRS